MQTLIYKYITHHHTHEKSGIINKQILNSSDEQLLTNLVKIESFLILIRRRHFLSIVTLL